MKKISDTITAYGHKNISGKHKTTIEITKENFLTKNGNCIIGVKADKSCHDINPKIKEELIRGKRIRIILETNGLREEIIACGSKDLILKNRNSIVIRKSNSIDDRTLSIFANKASIDINREFVENLKKDDTKITIIIEIIQNGKAGI